MRRLFENWKKYIGEGKVITGPWPGSELPEPELPEPDPEVEQTIEFVNSLDDQLAARLVEIYGNTMEIPIDKLEQLDQVVEHLEAVLKLLQKLFDLNLEVVLKLLQKLFDLNKDEQT